MLRIMNSIVIEKEIGMVTTPQYKIDRDVPMVLTPHNHLPKGRMVKWNLPLGKMEVGDSIFIPISVFSAKVQAGKDNVTHHCNNIIRCQVNRKTVSKKFKFSSRRIMEGAKVTGARMWRVL